MKEMRRNKMLKQSCHNCLASRFLDSAIFNYFIEGLLISVRANFDGTEIHTSGSQKSQTKNVVAIAVFCLGTGHILLWFSLNLYSTYSLTWPAGTCITPHISCLQHLQLSTHTAQHVVQIIIAVAAAATNRPSSH